MQIGIHLPQYGRVASPEAITGAARHAEQDASRFGDPPILERVFEEEGESQHDRYDRDTAEPIESEVQLAMTNRAGPRLGGLRPSGGLLPGAQPPLELLDAAFERLEASLLLGRHGRCCSSSSRSIERRGAISVRPPKRSALYAAVKSRTGLPSGEPASDAANSVGVNQAGFW